MIDKTKLAPALREAIEGREISDERLAVMTRYDVFHEYLVWNGIIGYTSEMWRVLESIAKNIPQKEQ